MNSVFSLFFHIKTALKRHCLESRFGIEQNNNSKFLFSSKKLFLRLVKLLCVNKLCYGRRQEERDFFPVCYCFSDKTR